VGWPPAPPMHVWNGKCETVIKDQQVVYVQSSSVKVRARAIRCKCVCVCVCVCVCEEGEREMRVLVCTACPHAAPPPPS
jgi:hypothetical protein